MKIGFKITLVAITGLIATLACLLVATRELGTLNDGAEFLKEVSLANDAAAYDLVTQYQNIIRFTAGMLVVPERIPRNLERIQTAGASVQKDLAFLKGNVRSEAGREGVAKIDAAVAEAVKGRLMFVEAIQRGDFEEATRLRFGGQYEQALDAALDAINDFKDNVTGAQMTTYVEETAPQTYANAKTMLIVVTVVAVLILAVLSIIIIVGITRPLTKAVTAANEVAKGNLKVDLQVNTKDEIGTLIQSFETMIGVIDTVIKDTNNLAHACIEGKLEVRSDASKFQGSYRELVTGINNTLDAVINPLNDTSGYLARIAKGDIPQKITSQAKGEFAVIRDNLNQCFESLHLIVADINGSIEKAVAGELKYRADANKHQGDYRKIMEGVNKLVEAFVAPLNEVGRFLDELEAGKDGIQPLNLDAKGDFNIIKTNVNNLHSFLNHFLGEIIKVGNGAKAGNLTVRTDRSAKGDWLKMEDAINDIVVEAERIVNDVGRTMKIMATGDLTPRITADYEGQFDDVKNNINLLGDSLTALISQLQEAIHTTASASAEISSTAETLAAATQEQSSQTDEVASAMEEMSRTVTDNAHSATKTADVAKHSGEVANNGGKVVKQTVDKMREIAAVVKTSADNIAKLGESSKKIGEIIGVIDDIADQTNLLSLNAAIEAARAGEQGRGFAVVADSVGKLAISTASATKEIADMIKGIQHDTESAVKAMEKGTSEVQSGIELADNAGHSLEDILAGINELLDMVNQIAAASEEQSATSEQISKNISSISKVAADSARNIEDVASTANELARMTSTLTSLVSQFKVDHNPRNHHSEAGGGRYLD